MFFFVFCFVTSISNVRSSVHTHGEEVLTKAEYYLGNCELFLDNVHGLRRIVPHARIGLHHSEAAVCSVSKD